MKNRILYSVMVVAFVWGCKSPDSGKVSTAIKLPDTFATLSDSVQQTIANRRVFFNDSVLSSLIDTALHNNRELLVFLQEIEMQKNEVKAKKGEYLPFAGLGMGVGGEKEGTYTRFGAVDEQLEIKHGTPFPVPLTDFAVVASASWEIDVWKKLHRAKKSAFLKYLAGVEGQKFLITNLVAEIAVSYYELMALDNSLEIVEKNVTVQSNALRVVRQQKEAARVSQLAVNRFEAQLLNTQNLQYAIKQRRIETENRINLLTGRFPQPIPRNASAFLNMPIDPMRSGVPSQLLANRPDIKQAEMELEAAKFDVLAARANFYPSLDIKAGIGYRAFNPALLLNPQSLLYNLAGDLVAPLVNRNAIKAIYSNATARQLQAVYKYEQTIINAYLDVLNQVSKMDNYAMSYETKYKEVAILTHSITIANNLFVSARADYVEVLLTQQELLQSKMELIEVKMQQVAAKISLYRALGGGWNE